MNRNLLAIDIQDRYISAVVSTGWPGRSRIVDVCSVEIESGNTHKKDLLEKGVAELSEKLEGPFHRTVVGLPASLFFFRTIEVPFHHKKKIARILPFELESMLAVPAEDIKVDFTLPGGKTETRSGMTCLSAVCIRESVLQYYQKLFAASPFSPDVLTVGSGYASALALAADEGSAGASDILICLDYTHAAVFWIKSGDVAFIRSFPVNTADDDQRADIIGSNIKRTAFSCTQILGAQADIGTIRVCGSLPIGQAFSERLSERVGHTVEPLNFRRSDGKSEGKTMAFPEGSASKQGFSENAAFMAECISRRRGMCNFLRQESLLSTVFSDNKYQIAATVILAFLAMGAWGLNPLIGMNIMKSKIESIDREIARTVSSNFPDLKVIPHAAAHQMKTRIAQLKEKQGLPEAFETYVPCIDILRDLCIHLSEELDLTITRFVKSGQTLLVTGSTDGFNTVDEMKKNLENAERFKAVDINSASMDKQDRKVKFTMKITI